MSDARLGVYVVVFLCMGLEGGLAIVGGFVEQGVYFRFGQAKYFSKFSHYGIGLKGAVGGQQRCSVVFVFVEDVLGDMVAVLP